MLHNFPVNKCKLHLNAFDDLASQAALQSFLINGTNARPRGILWTPVRIRNPSKECTGVDLGHLSHPSLKTLLPSKSMYLRVIEWIRHSQKRLKGRLDIQHLRKWHRCCIFTLSALRGVSFFGAGRPFSSDPYFIPCWLLIGWLLIGRSRGVLLSRGPGADSFWKGLEVSFILFFKLTTARVWMDRCNVTFLKHCQASLSSKIISLLWLP